MGCRALPCLWGVVGGVSLLEVGSVWRSVVPVCLAGFGFALSAYPTRFEFTVRLLRLAV